MEIFELIMILVALGAGGGATAIFNHLRGRALRNPVGVAADAAALAAAIKVAADDRKITASELADLAKKADSLASKLK